VVISDAVKEFSPSGQLLMTLSTAPGLGGQDVYSVALDSYGNVYVSNAGFGRVYEYSTTGQYIGVFATGPNGYAGDMAFDALGNLYVAGGNAIEKISATGQDLGQFALLTTGNSANGLAFDPTTGNLVAADSGGHITEFSPTGQNLGVFATLPTGAAFYLAFQPPSVVPEPNSLTLLGLAGAMGTAVSKWRRRKSAVLRGSMAT
jgi:DNA-binding beta-propeller fold protein YncE